MPVATAPTEMTFDAAVGVAVNQYLLTHNLTRAQAGVLLGVAGSNISQRLRGRITWPAEDLFKLAEAFGIEVADLYPSRAADGSWVPAAYVPGMRKTPARVGAGVSGMVAGEGFEPSTSGLGAGFARLVRGAVLALEHAELVLRHRLRGAA